MTVEVMFVTLAGIASFIWLIHAGMKHEERKLDLQRSGGEDVARLGAVVEETSKEMARLRDSVAVLEKLVTDDDRKLADEINRLGRIDTGARSQA